MPRREKTLPGSGPGNPENHLADLLRSHPQVIFPIALPRGIRTGDRVNDSNE